mmetsp:Transcript_22100/g.68616  ORF Transcript_22100/g.68616 Transcript_22100/m.68616 type:complete len:242 (+) Transcript_22100:1010-1735(+)
MRSGSPVCSISSLSSATWPKTSKLTFSIPITPAWTGPVAAPMRIAMLSSRSDVRPSALSCLIECTMDKPISTIFRWCSGSATGTPAAHTYASPMVLIFSRPSELALASNLVNILLSISTTTCGSFVDEKAVNLTMSLFNSDARLYVTAYSESCRPLFARMSLTTADGRTLPSKRSERSSSLLAASFVAATCFCEMNMRRRKLSVTANVTKDVTAMTMSSTKRSMKSPMPQARTRKAWYHTM